MYYTQEQIDRANQADLVSFLQSQGEQLTRAGQEYRWKRHDSLTIRGNKWYRHSQSKGGAPVDFVMEFFGKSFTEAVEMLTGEKGAAPPPDRPSPAPLSDFRLPPRSTDNNIARNYLTAARRIDEDVTGFFFASGDIYEDAAHHNAVFVGRDEDGVPRYAHQRGTAGSFRLDVKGSDKAFNFCYRGAGERLFVFEAPIDLLSFLCLFKKDWQKQSYLSLGGVGEKALFRFLSDRPNIKTVFLCLDSDEAGNDACSRLAELVPEGLTVHRLIPLFKDWNEVLQHRAEIADGKYIREAIYGLKEPPQEETVEIIRMSEVDTQTVEWLFSFLQANGIQSMQQLHEKIADMNSCYYDLRGKIVKAERRIAILTERGEMWEQYNQYKSIHKQLAKVKPEKREQFEQRHSRELILYDAAARYLKELKDSGEGITPKAWQLEIDQLAAGKQTDTLAMKSMREDLKAVERLRKTAEQLSRQERDKSHDRGPER